MFKTILLTETDDKVVAKISELDEAQLPQHERAVRVAVTLDRTIDVAAEGISAVPLTPTGTEWRTTRLADRRLRLQPQARVNAATFVNVEFPRLRLGETVQVIWANPSTTARYRVGAVDGLTIDLETDVVVPAGATNIRLRRLIPDDPQTGTELIARDGRPASSREPPDGHVDRTREGNGTASRRRQGVPVPRTRNQLSNRVRRCFEAQRN